MNDIDPDGLLRAAKEITTGLGRIDANDRLRVKPSQRATRTDTAGWAVSIAKLKERPVHLEVWIDRYSGHHEPKFYACFWASAAVEINRIVRSVPKELTPVRTVLAKDTVRRPVGEGLIKRLRSPEFDAPIVERYPAKRSFFFGMYSPTRGRPDEARRHFCQRAVAFYEAILETLNATRRQPEPERDVYPQIENRQRIVAHLKRERSSLLSRMRKIQDEYTCQVCGFRFTEFYGEIGEAFAESHHLDALGKTKGPVITSVDDLATVCANCHRMLHKMSGHRSDLEKLQKIVRKHRVRK